MAGAVKVRGAPSPALLTKLREAKAELAQYLAEIAGRPETLVRPPSWLDLDDWCRLLGEQRSIAARRTVLFDWIDAAGGRSDATSVHLPACLPRKLALATLKAHARALGLAVHEVADKAETGP